MHVSSLTTIPRRLALVDDRAVRPAVALGWRTPPLLLAPSAAAAEAIHLDQRSDEGASVIAAVTSPAAATRWILRRLAEASDAGTTRPISTVIATAAMAPALTAAMEGAGLAFARERQPAPVASTLAQRIHQGRFISSVVGSDAAGEWGAAATMLAARVIVAPPDGVISRAVAEVSGRGSVEFRRGLLAGVPIVRWRFEGDGGDGLRLMEAVLRVANGFPALRDTLARVRHDTFAALRAMDRSPFDIARAATWHEVMGWGGALVLRPEEEFTGVADDDVSGALRALVGPIAEASGWG